MTTTTGSRCVGVDIVQVISDDKHYRPFVCSLCVKVVALDALVSTKCSHPYCKTCLQNHVVQFAEDRNGEQQQQQQQQPIIACPNCGVALEAVDSSGTTATTASSSSSNIMMQLNGILLAVQPLQEAQPLAYQCLSWIQVACMGSHSKRCHWSGNYSDYPLHLAACISRPSSSIAGSHMDPLTQPPRQPTRGISNDMHTPPSNLQRTKSLPSIFLLQQAGDAAALMQSPNNKDADNIDADIILVSPPSGDDSPIVLANKSMVLDLADYSPAVDNNNNHNQLLLAQEQLQNQNQPTTPPLSFRKSASLRDFTKQDMDLPPPTVANTTAASSSKQLPSSQQQQPQHPRRWAAGEPNSSTTNATAVTASSAAAAAEQAAAQAAAAAAQYPITTKNETTTTSPSTDDNRVRDIPPSAVKRSKQQQPAVRRNTQKPVPEDKRLRKGGRRNSARAIMTRETDIKSENDSFSSVGDLNGEYSENERGGYTDGNASINSLTGWGANNSSSALQTMAALVEQAIDGDEGESNISSTVAKNNSEASVSTTDREQMAELIARAEKLKKQANAKFNKGDFTSARTLYTLGIQIMAKLEHRLGPKEAEMLSNMHSNRAVTFFREKNFIECMQDCEVAIQYDPYYEKSWIRKWRALMALGKFQTALECLETMKKQSSRSCFHTQSSPSHP
jgi:hypothetical protein